MEHNPTQFVAGVARLDWLHPETVRNVTAVPVAPELWFGVAADLEVRNPAAAQSLYAFVGEHSHDREVLLTAATRRLVFAKATGDDAAAKAAREHVLSLVSDRPADKLSAIGALAQAHEEQLIGEICGDARDPRLAWPCAENNPTVLPKYLDAIADLPVFSFGDAERLEKVDVGRQLHGLACASISSFRPNLQHVLHPPRASPLPAEPTIYYRLSLEAPVERSACFLEAASVACAQLIVNGESCPVPYVIAEYAKTLPPDQQEALIQTIIQTKDSHYALLHAGHPGEADVLFHLHLLAAELLAASPSLMRDDRLWQPQYHTGRALMLYRFFSGTYSKFIDLLTPELRSFVCDTDVCGRVCRNSTRERACRSDCAKDAAGLATACFE